MHNCRETRERVTELLLDGVDCRSDEAVSAELRSCPDCRSEFESLSVTLRITSRATEVVTPAKEYWTDYHSKLRQRLVNAQNGPTNSRAQAQRHKEKQGPLFEPLRPGAGRGLLTRFFTASVPVPLPIGIALVVAAALLIPLGIRAARKDVQPKTETTYIRVPYEVPVVQEKIVTRVVYRDRYPVVKSSKQPADASGAESTFARSEKPQNEMTLTGFKPADQVKLTVIKGGVPNER
jgi:hypothetical protein